MITKYKKAKTMKLITTSTDLEKEFRRLTKQYDNYYWATAWASSGSKLFNDLLENKAKIQKIVVGIHFYQTDPDFIETFLNNKKVHFIQQPNGTFHPKLYLFTDKTDKWELLIGSANFTTAAFTKNTEANFLLTSQDCNSSEIYNYAMKLVGETFADTDGKTFTKDDLDKYRPIWGNHRQKIKSLSGQYGSQKNKTRPIYEVAVINRSWEKFMNDVRSETFHGLDKRLNVIETAKGLFNKVTHFNELDEDERKFIAGIPNKLDGTEDWAYFGSMEGAGVFKNKIISNNVNISKALDQIPLSGQITKKHYDNYINYFTQAFSGIATATRLLCMKRPDIFICYNSKNRSGLCKDFGIIQSKMDYERYWDDIILRIYDSIWWQKPNPINETEERVSEARAAFLDSLYYKE